jgi:hypothetical protein
VQRHAGEENGVKGEKGYFSHLNVIVRVSGVKVYRRYNVEHAWAENPGEGGYGSGIVFVILPEGRRDGVKDLA